MPDIASGENPFGHSISSDDILDTLGFFDSWEDRYKYIIDLGKELPPMPATLHTDDRLVRGCQSQVWIDTRLEEGRLQLTVDSDAFIVKGLLGLVLAAYNNKAPADVLAFDIDAYFAQLDLLRHLSPTRGNGLRAMVQRIQDIARQAS
jgi:cysteine desulfuration protein SufE